MDMKEKMPITPTTPVPTPSAAIAAEAHRRGAFDRRKRTARAIEAEAGSAASAIEVSQEASADAAEASTPAASRRCAPNDVSVFYGDKQALKDVSIDIYDDLVTAFIGPSGCGKSTFLRCLNRMNDTIPSARVTGRIELDGEDITSSAMDVVQLRARVGMVFQKPNPFPKSIYRECRLRPAHPRPCRNQRRSSTRSSRSR